MRVLFAVWAWPSHFFPMVPLAWAMHSAGHEVRVASQPELMGTMGRSGLPIVAVGQDFDVAGLHRGGVQHLRATHGRATAASAQDSTVPDRALFGELGKAIRATRPDRRSTTLSMFGEVAEAMAGDLVEFARWWRPDLVVFDPLTYAGPLAAQLLGVPSVRHMFGPDVTYFTHQAESERLRPLWQSFGLDGLDLLGTVTVDPTPPSLQFPGSVAPVERIPTRYVPYNGLSEIPSWLCRPALRRRICLTWGTSTFRLVGDDGFVPASLLGGCAELAAERGAELVVAITAGQRGLLPAVPEGVRVAESVPLHALLPTCDAVIYQGGAGTMLTALWCGLPQVILTQLPDQGVNATNLAASGAGTTMLVDHADASEAVAAVRMVLDDPSYRAAAQRLRQEMAEQPPPAAVVDRLVALADRELAGTRAR